MKGSSSFTLNEAPEQSNDNVSASDTEKNVMTGIASMSKMWKITIEVKMEDLLCLLKTKLPLHCYSPTLFRRRFRSLFTDCFERRKTKAYAEHFQWIFQTQTGRKDVWNTENMNNVEYLATNLNWNEAMHNNESGAPSRICTKVVLVFKQLCSMFYSSNAMIKFLDSSSDKNFQQPHERTVVAEILLELVYRVDSMSIIPPEIERYMPLVRTSAYFGITEFCRDKYFTKYVAEFSGSKDKYSDTVTADNDPTLIRYIEKEWLMVVSIVQSLYSVDFATVQAAFYSLQLKDLNAVLFLSFIFVVESCQLGMSDNSQNSERLIATADEDSVYKSRMEFFVNWLQSIFRPVQPLYDSNSIENEGKNSYQRSVDDVLLEKFLSMYQTKGCMMITVHMPYFKPLVFY